jgi:hypothetical protein
MDFQRFEESLSQNTPPAGISEHLLSLWYDYKNDWGKSHDIIQSLEDDKASWIHAYLHRKEGDNSNADYWYRRAGKTRPTISLKNGWDQIAKALTS